VKRRALISLFVLIFAVPCFGGGDPEFHAAVRTIEAQYGVHHMHIPFGLATFCLKVAQVPCMSGLKIAVFDHLSRANGISYDSFEESLESAVGTAWRPLVRVRSNDENQLTLVYANPSDKEMRTLIICLQPDNATVVQAKVSVAQIRKWIEKPDEITHELD
jgi:hypothetical protein